jgi:hypothetical protein
MLRVKPCPQTRSFGAIDYDRIREQHGSPDEMRVAVHRKILTIGPNPRPQVIVGPRIRRRGA